MSGILESLARSSGSIKPRAGSFFPEGTHRDLEVTVTALEIDEDAQKPVGGGQTVPVADIIFTLQLVSDPDGPDPDCPRSFRTKRVDNFQIIPDESLAGGPDWLSRNAEFCLENLAKFANILVGEDATRPLEKSQLGGLLLAIKSYLDNPNNPRPRILVDTKERKDGDYTNRNVWPKALLANPVQ